MLLSRAQQKGLLHSQAGIPVQTAGQSQGDQARLITLPLLASESQKAAKIRDFASLAQEEEIEVAVESLSTRPLTGVIVDAQPVQEKQEQEKQEKPAQKTSFVSSPTGEVRLRRFVRLRKAFIILAVLAIAGLLVDGGLTVMMVSRLQWSNAGMDSAPLMLLSRSTANRGESIVVRFLHCQPLAQLLITRDIQEPVRLAAGTPLVRVNTRGEATVHISIDESWKAGSHRIVAEDVKTHYMMRSPLYVTGVPAAQAAHLQVSQQSLDMGTDVQWKITSRVLTLSNAGSGVISWAASSDRSWLLLTPSQGQISDTQNVVLSVTRARLAPGIYEGTITFAASAGAPVMIHVTMTVQALTDRSAPLPGIMPAALSFVSSDGGVNPGEQVLMISNPGSRPLNWVLQDSTTVNPGQAMSDQNDANWLHLEATSGVIPAGGTTPVRVFVHSQTLLQGTYTRMLTFAVNQGQGTASQRQSLAVSLNVAPPCGVLVGSDYLPFTMISGSPAPVSQALKLSMPPGCSGASRWHAYPLTNWLGVTPDGGLVAARTEAALSVTINVNRLPARDPQRSYEGMLAFVTSQRTDVILVQAADQANLLTEPGGQAGQPLPGLLTAIAGTATGNTSSAPSTPLPSVTLQTSVSSITLSATQGQASTPGQSLTISDAGNHAFAWKASIDGANASWLSVTPGSGAVAAGQTAQIVVSGNVGRLDSGTYIARLTIIPLDAAASQVGSARTVFVTLNVYAPCSLQVSPAKLTFSASLLQSSPPAQNITLLSGNSGCAYPITWTATTNRTWITLSALNGSENGMGSIITVNVNRSGKLLGSYTGQVTITALDNNGVPMRNGSQVVTVVLNVLG
ncbi:MAG: hypothetical protein IMW89_03950 [Ktedonobacteraceae bacterium]|nr:hypothetical protein [Ktedonobacteraceae bacterium]